MNNIDFIIDNEMRKHEVKGYHVKPQLITVAPGTTESISSDNDFTMFIHAWASTGSVNGRVNGKGASLDILPRNLLTMLFKHKIFKGNYTVTNNDATNTLYVEMLRITPIFNN